ncbi:unnamed protein product [Rotaria magnacalcarata]|uniref:SAM domain-containing protein n=3 Tax=Rotaria magnacalcarata TaxID=392030 RepID=A0A815HEP3_9BILA|nr:unnamed protein product [Rotaria magnacalcarata]
MADWTTEQVGQWLKSNGFEQFAKTFKGKRIDGIALFNLNDDEIVQLISCMDGDKKKNKTNIKKFKEKLNEWKMDHNENLSRRRNAQRSSASSVLSTVITTETDETLTIDKNVDVNYTKPIAISNGNNGVYAKFFNNRFFRTHLQQYLSQKYDIKCSVKLERQQSILELVGMKHPVKVACHDIKVLFESLQTKIYNSQTTDQKSKRFDYQYLAYDFLVVVIYWSTHIFSDSAIDVIQNIMNNERIFTAWNKSEMFSGYYEVMYFNHESFGATDEVITRILNREIAYVENIRMPNEKTKAFINEIENFVSTVRHPELNIIHCKYPFQMEIKISLFGRKSQVKKIKKQIDVLVNKYTLKPFIVRMTSDQHDYLVDNCLQQLKDIENMYKNDNVQIRIRQKEFYAPQYLIEEIKKHIYELICQTAICTMQTIESLTALSDDDNVKLNEIAKKYCCSIERIESNVETEIHRIPKALTNTSSTPSLIIQKSNKFCSSLSVRKISVSNGSIEIYVPDYSTQLSKDVTIISTNAGLQQEHVEPDSENGLLQMPSGRKIILCRLPNRSGTDSEAREKFKKTIRKFLSRVTQMIINNCSDAERIAFSTCDWEDLCNEPQLIEELLLEMKQVIETGKQRWRFLFIFNHEQKLLCNKFLQVMIGLQSDEDGFAQFTCSILKTHVILTTVKGNDLAPCENEINCYIRNKICGSETLKNISNLHNWNQHMINIFYKYCLEKFVLPSLNLTTFELQLVGPPENIQQAKEKYKLISEILKLKSLAGIPFSVGTKSPVQEKQQSNKIDKNSHNIAFSYCLEDEVVCQHLTMTLIDEGYKLYYSSSNIGLSQAQIEKSDLLLIYFNENYTKDKHCMANLNYAKSIGKTIIPIAEMKNVLQDTEENFWLNSVKITQLFYDLFDREIEIEFTGDSDLEYDYLLAKLLCHTKPGMTDQIYPQISEVSEVKHVDKNYEQNLFGYTSKKLQEVTNEQRKEKENAYKRQLNKRIENEKISSDEIDILVGNLILVVEDLEEFLQGKNPNHDIYSGNRSIDFNREQNDKYRRANAIALLHCIKRWLNKAPNVMKKNIAPFTPTGDINDALFTSYQTTGRDWLADDDDDDEQSNNVLSKDYFSAQNSNSGYWFTSEQAQDYFQSWIKTDRRTSIIETKLEENETAWPTISISEMNTEIRGNQDETIDNQWKTPEEIKHIQELDNPNRIWKRAKHVSAAFMKQKLRNIIEFQKLCDSRTNV